MARNSRGFTLIELLVVISIIALLIGLLLPSLSQARTSARQLAELSNMRQMTIAATTYTGDFQGWLNPIQDDHAIMDGGTMRRREGTWRAYLWKFVASTPFVYDSPGEKQDRYADGLSQWDIDNSGGRVSSPKPDAFGEISIEEMYNRSGLGANLVHYWSGREGKGPFGRPFVSSWGRWSENGSGYSEGLSMITEIEAPTQCVFFGSGGTDDPRWPEDSWWIYKQDAPVRGLGFSRYLQFLETGSDKGALRFNGRGNYTFADGSGKALDPRDIPCNENACLWSIDRDPHN